MKSEKQREFTMANKKREIIIHLVPTFHHDIAYLRPEKDFTAAAVRIMDRVLDIMGSDDQYTYTVEQAYFFEYYWNTHPEKQAALKKYCEEGRLVFAPGFFAVPDMCMPDGESLFQTATLGRRILNSLVKTNPKVAYIADSWGHHAQLPQILSSCGYDSYAFSRAMTRELDRENFNWQGLDGTVIKGHWFSTGYAGLNFPDNLPEVNAEELEWEDISGITKLYARNAQKCGDAPQIMPVGGDMKMPAASAPRLVKELQKDENIPYPAFSSLDKAMDAIDFSKEPVYDHEFLSLFKGSFSTNIQIKLNNRALENKLYDTEVLSVLTGVKADLYPYWRTTLKNQFHDILCGTVCDDGLTQALTEQKAALEGLDCLRDSIVKGPKDAYLNTLPFDRVELDGHIRHSAKGFSFAEDRELDSFPASLPCTFENDYYVAAFNERGSITKLTEKKSGKVLVDSPRVPFGALVLEADSGDNWVEFEYPWEYDPSKYDANFPDPLDRSALPVHPKVRLSLYGVREASATALEDGSLIVTQKGQLNYWQTQMPFTIRITCAKDHGRIDYHTEFECRNRRLRLRAAFPITLENYKVRHQIPYGIVERGEGPQPLNYFMDVEGAEASIALLNKGLPANNTENGVMLLTLFRSVAMEYKCQSELSYNVGKHFSCDYSIVPHVPGEDAELFSQALSLQHPFLKTSRMALLPVSVTGAQLSCMRYDNDAVFLRIYNGTDRPVKARVAIGGGTYLYAFTDGNMDPVTSYTNMPEILTIGLEPYRIQGIKIK